LLSLRGCPKIAWVRAPTFALVAFLVVVLAQAAGPAHAAGNENPDLKARTLFAAGEYQQALDIYASLYAETLHPTYLRNIARCYQNLGEPDKAISSFKEYLRKARELTPEQRKEIDGYIAEMEQLKRSRVAAVAPPPVAPLPVAPPPAAPPPPATEQAAPLVGPTTVTATHEPADDSAPIYTRTWFWLVVGGVAAASVTGIVLLGRDTSPAHGPLGYLDLDK
jgi:tetratricopeptide (TPR) repeat protein